MVAALARVREYPFPLFVLDMCGWHHASAGSCPITWRGINMLAVETVRAVVGVAISFYMNPTVLAGKILNSSYKSHTLLNGKGN